VIHVYGQGTPQHLFDLIDHHAEGVAHLVAPLAIVLLDVLGRDEHLHEVHIGKGWNSVNLYLANGEKIALRARISDVHRGSINPLGTREMQIRDGLGVERLRRSLKWWS
jgi:hypothetical protein